MAKGMERNGKNKSFATPVHSGNDIDRELEDDGGLATHILSLPNS
jgi:hypothetical protein